VRPALQPTQYAPPPASGDLYKYFVDTAEGRTYSMQLFPLSFTTGLTKLNYIFGLFSNYFYCLNLDGKIYIYVFGSEVVRLLTLYTDICKLIR